MKKNELMNLLNNEYWYHVDGNYMDDYLNYLKKQLFYDIRVTPGIGGPDAKKLKIRTLSQQSATNYRRYSMDLFYLNDIQKKGNITLLYFDEGYMVLKRTSLITGILRLSARRIFKDVCSFFSKFNMEDVSNEA